MPPIITLTTDFGTADGYVGAMKGVILNIHPGVTIVDLSHEIPPQNVRQAAFVLHTAAPYFPAGTIHLAVVDPGVGSARRPIAIQIPGATLVGPDNGLFSFFLTERPAGSRSIIQLTRPAFWLPAPSHTFHGRDIFAPVAAHLARGVPITDLGDPIDDPVVFPIPQPKMRLDGAVVAHVLHIDHFGNLVTDVRATGPMAPHLGAETTVEIAGRRIAGVRQTFADVATGEPVAYVGSSGYLEIAIRQGNAAAVLGVTTSDELVIRQK